MSADFIGPGIETAKEFYSFWKNFRKKKVRVWFSHRDKRSHYCFQARAFLSKAAQIGTPSAKTDGKAREIIGLEGRIVDIPKFPPGLMLEEVSYWVTLDQERSRDKYRSEEVEKVRSSDKAVFVPIATISKIDIVD